MSMPIKTGPAGRTLIKSKETLRLVAYPDPKTGGAPWTIGWGHTRGVCAGMSCTVEQAEQWLTEDLSLVELTIRGNVHVSLNQNQFDAFGSLLFNVGSGTKDKDGIIRLKSGNPSHLLRYINANDFASACVEWLKWDSPGSNVEHGLELRRQEEVALFKTPCPA